MTEEPSVEIGSPGASLTLSRPEWIAGRVEHVRVDLDVDGMHAHRRVYAGIDRDFLTTFFRGLATDWRGWDGSRTLLLTEFDLNLTAFHDGIGHVVLEVQLGRLPPHEWHEAGWAVTAHVIIEPGSLGRIADAVADLLAE